MSFVSAAVLRSARRRPTTYACLFFCSWYVEPTSFLRPPRKSSTSVRKLKCLFWSTTKSTPMARLNASVASALPLSVVLVSSYVFNSDQSGSLSYLCYRWPSTRIVNIVENVVWRTPSHLAVSLPLSESSVIQNPPAICSYVQYIDVVYSIPSEMDPQNDHVKSH